MMRDGTVGHSATTVAGSNWNPRSRRYSRNRIDDVVACRLRNARARRLTRPQLTWKLGIDHSRIGKYERGRNNMTMAMSCASAPRLTPTPWTYSQWASSKTHAHPMSWLPRCWPDTMSTNPPIVFR
ncbi:hypothetical protein AB0L13_46150 [Saccharopolyspora shandongensis]|uniref:hypothetical protein n=1 Tax=Saccharopolyspora shandongensis TaxID=418495 RepID=UPI00341ECF2B